MVFRSSNWTEENKNRVEKDEGSIRLAGSKCYKLKSLD